jgi:1-aminocyclopropane-1-carboxylate deaminase/D-cysteine desulfhydrase-like pyridoxal-dependent ACC family enzyme
MQPLTLGRYPTPVERLDALSNARTELWVKRDDLTNPVYGGNKVRKLDWLLSDARAHRAKRIVTVGAAGSHHVLATTYFGHEAGFDVEAVLVPQPRTEHVVQVLRASIGLGLRATPVASWGAAAFVMAARMALMATRDTSTYIIPVGGSNRTGAMGYVAAARELAAQVRAGEMPEPDVCVVALGSGGTAGGLAAGLAAEGMSARVVGVCVSKPPWALHRMARLLAWACAPKPARPQLRLAIDTRFLGRGYGHGTPEGDEATDIARAAGLTLDPAYTAKAFASALWHVRARRGHVVLFWQTLSSAPIEPLLSAAPMEANLSPRLRRLLLPTT